MIIAVKTVGLLLILLGAANLVGMFAFDLSMLISPVAVAVRYSLMIVAGVGFFLAYKWAAFVYLGSLAINWFTFFLVYDGQSLAPVWLSLPIPIAIIVLVFFAWDRLKPQSDRD